MSWLALVGLLGVVMIVVGRSRRGATPSAPTAVPSHLPVRTKRYFFSLSERQLYAQLLAVLPSHQYAVFPNVRISDLFTIEASGSAASATYARMREKHVDFLVVTLPEFTPCLGIELDGPSHRAAPQQYRDAVKNVIFESAQLPLLRLSTNQKLTTTQLAALLAPLLSRQSRFK